jgi:glycosyltransferase involved in cell wall biosynthesis
VLTTQGTLPFVSVIVPVYNGAAFLSQCLGALGSQNYPAERYETLVVFNDGSPSCVGANARRFAVRCLQESTPSSYAARNRGILHARGSVLAFTDVDCVPDPDWLRNGVQALTENPRYGFVGGRIEIVPKSPARLSLVERYEKSNHFLQKMYVDQLRFAATANMFTTREVINRVGMFNSNLKSGGDKEWGSRAASLGFQGFYEPAALIRHDARSLGALLRKARRIAGGVVDRQRLNRAQGMMIGKRGFVSDYIEERRNLWGRSWRIQTTEEACRTQKLTLGLLSLLIFGVSLMERWRVRLGAESLRS